MPRANPLSDKQRIFVTLDGLRGLAALAVISRHASRYFGAMPFESYLAVDFFFVLSGFVLAHAYRARLQAGLSAADFMKIRLIRLYPLYILALGIACAAVLLKSAYAQVDFSAFIGNLVLGLLFLPSPLDSYLFPLNGPSWSLFNELLANLFLKPAVESVRIAAVITAIAGALLVFGVCTSTLGFGQRAGAMDSGFAWAHFGAGPVRAGFSFFAGVLLHRLYVARPMRFNVPALPIFAALGLMLALHPPKELQASFDLAAAMIGFPLLVWCGAHCAPRPFTARVFTWLGISSYAVYVLHAPAYAIASQLMAPSAASAWTAITFTIFIFAAAIVADHCYDFPVRRWLLRRMEGRMRLRAAAPSA
ncbi:MAG TPA: acyltransferase [Xanthobacteraceae bacterium]|nr:acyltransferase [Xanthobacteraceae bacterium]